MEDTRSRFQPNQNQNHHDHHNRSSYMFRI